MKFVTSLEKAVLLQRYKRFLADVRLGDGTLTTVHTANTGRMLGCADRGCRVWLRHDPNPKRRYAYSWVVTETAEGCRIGVDTGLANKLVAEAINQDRVQELQDYSHMRREVRYGRESSRIDLLLQGHARRPDCYVEVKNVTLAENDRAMFPDAVSARGTKHLRELMHVVEQGGCAAVVFCAQREDVDRFSPAAHIDPLYADTLHRAAAAGVQVLAYKCHVSTTEIVLRTPLAVELER